MTDKELAHFIKDCGEAASDFIRAGDIEIALGWMKEAVQVSEKEYKRRKTKNTPRK